MQDKNRSECKTRLDTRVLQNIPIFHSFVELTNGTYIKKSKFLLYNSTSKNFVQIVISNEGETSPSGTIITAFFFQKRNRLSHTNDLFPRRHRCVSHESARDYKTAAVVTYRKSPLCQDEILRGSASHDTACNVVISNSSGWNHHQDGNIFLFSL